MTTSFECPGKVIADFYISGGASVDDYYTSCAHAVLECIAQKLADENRLSEATLHQMIFETSPVDLCAWLKDTPAIHVLHEAPGRAGVLSTMAQAVNVVRYAAKQNRAA